jgi:hypothetical protein
MSIADELRKLQELQASGALTPEEFAQAKAVLLKEAPAAPDLPNLSPDSLSVEPDQVVTPLRMRTMQTIASALLIGVIGFLGFVLYFAQVVNNGKPLAPPQNMPMISFIAVAMFCMCVPLSFIIPSVQIRSALWRILQGRWSVPLDPEVDPAVRAQIRMSYATAGDKLMLVRQTTMIVAFALLEGSAVMACLSYLLEGQPFVLAIVGADVFFMLCKFPTEGRIRAWLERQAVLLGEMRQEVESTSPGQ